MPNGESRNWIRFLTTLEGYFALYGKWPTSIRLYLIAAGLSPLAPERGLVTASRLFLQEIEARIVHGEDFAFETTLAGRGHLKLIHRLKNAGWQVELIYLTLSSVEMSKLRVAERVSHGGHDIAEQDIERRFPRSLHNVLTLFGSVVDRCICLMNDNEDPVMVFEQEGDNREVHQDDYFQWLLKEAGI